MLSTAPIGLPPHTHRPHALVQACRAVLRARKLIPAVAALAGLGGHALADSLTTTYAGGNGHRGNMFDVTSTELVEITGLQLNLMNAVTDYQVFYRVGTWIGNATSSAGWTLLQSGTATGSVVGPSDLITLNTPLAIASGQSYAFYVTSTNRSISLDYTNGTSTGAVAATDGVLTIYQGAGLEYAFGQGGSVLEPRIWNGTVYYETPNNFYWTGQADGRWSGANWFTNTGERSLAQPTALFFRQMEPPTVARRWMPTSPSRA